MSTYSQHIRIPVHIHTHMIHTKVYTWHTYTQTHIHANTYSHTYQHVYRWIYKQYPTYGTGFLFLIGITSSVVLNKCLVGTLDYNKLTYNTQKKTDLLLKLI